MAAAQASRQYGSRQQERLEAIMLRENISAAELAGALGMTPRTFKRKACRESEFTAKELEAIYTRLNMSAEELMQVFFC